MNIDKYQKDNKELNEKVTRLMKSIEFLTKENDTLSAELDKYTINKENAEETTSPRTINTKNIIDTHESPSDSVNTDESSAKQAKNGCAQQ
jgi:hypothetical protein